MDDYYFQKRVCNYYYQGCVNPAAQRPRMYIPASRFLGLRKSVSRVINYIYIRSSLWSHKTNFGKFIRKILVFKLLDPSLPFIRTYLLYARCSLNKLRACKSVYAY